MSDYRWLVTGASSGQGAEIVLAALRAGYSVVASARSLDKAKEAYPDVEQLGGIWAELDVTDVHAQQKTEELVKKFNISVIVNNAGYGLRGVLEDLRYAGPLPT